MSHDGQVENAFAFMDDGVAQGAYDDQFGLEALAEEAGPAGRMSDGFDQPMGGLEAMAQDAMPESEAPMEGMMQPHEEPMPEDEMMPDPWLMPGGFGPGFGPMGPMPGP